MNRGYIKLFRKIEDTELFMDDEEPFDKRSAWIDILLMVNHKDGFAFSGMNKIIIKRGQKKTSISKLAQRWHWGRRKTSAYLNMLQTEGMVYLDVSNSGLLITVVNYDVYQDFLGKSEQPTAQPKAQPIAQQVHNEQHNQPHTNNNDKNDKNDKNIKKENTTYFPKKEKSQFSVPSVEEVAAYCRNRQNGIDAEQFVDFYESKGWMIGKNKMKNWQAAVRTWERMNRKDNTEPNNGLLEDGSDTSDELASSGQVYEK